MDRQTQIDFILDHYEHPHNYRELPDATVVQEGHNPGCGDRVTIYVKIHDRCLAEITFAGEGCTISQASASMTTDLLAGFTIEQVEAASPDTLAALIGPEIAGSRPNCVALALNTTKDAIRAYRRAAEADDSVPILRQFGRLEGTN